MEFGVLSSTRVYLINLNPILPLCKPFNRLVTHEEGTKGGKS
jgi:hypothetical protein